MINSEIHILNDPGQYAYTSGWGWIYSGTSSSSNHLVGIQIPLISNEDADRQLDISYSGHLELTNNMLATGFEGNDRLSPYHGDNGSPLTVSDKNNIV